MHEDMDAVLLWVRDITTRTTPSSATVVCRLFLLVPRKIETSEQYDLACEESDPDYVDLE